MLDDGLAEEEVEGGALERQRLGVEVGLQDSEAAGERGRFRSEIDAGDIEAERGERGR